MQNVTATTEQTGEPSEMEVDAGTAAPCRYSQCLDMLMQCLMRHSWSPALVLLLAGRGKALTTLTLPANIEAAKKFARTAMP